MKPTKSNPTSPVAPRANAGANPSANPPRCRARHADSRLVILATGLMLGAWGLGPSPVAEARQPTEGVEGLSSDDLHALYYGVHAPEDRELGRRLQLAERLTNAGRHAEAAQLLGRILDANEDSFTPFAEDGANGPPDLGLSVRGRVLAMLGRDGPQGEACRSAYLLEFEAQSRRDFLAAVAPPDAAALADLARRRPYTPASQAALWTLAQIAADQGRPAEGVGWLEEGARRAARADRAPWLIELAGALVAAGRGDEATATLGRVDNLPDALASSGFGPGRAATVDDALRLFQETPASPAAPPHGAPAVPTIFGPPTTWAQPPWVEWLAPVETTPQAASVESPARRRPSLPPRAPLAVGDVALLRSQGRLIALSSSSGKRLWETTKPRTTQRQDPWAQLADPDTGDLSRFDVLGSSLSTDGARVYALLDGASGASRPALGQRSRGLNRLAAFRLDAQGKLAWELDGGAPDSPLRGAYFLSSPLATNGLLLVCVEAEQAIQLVALNPQTGAPVWRQALAGVELAAPRDAMRRLVGAALAEQDGRVVCSTGAGLVVSFDLYRRTLGWTYRLPVDAEARPTDTAWRRSSADTWPSPADSHWLRNQLLVDGGRLLLATPESHRLHCLDLVTGAPVWHCERERGLALGGVVGRSVLVLSEVGITARASATGEVAWRVAAGGTLAGLGVTAGDAYLAPLTDGRIAVFNAQDGAPREPFAPRPLSALGDLTACGGGLLWQSGAGAARIELATDPNGATPTPDDERVAAAHDAAPPPHEGRPEAWGALARVAARRDASLGVRVAMADHAVRSGRAAEALDVALDAAGARTAGPLYLEPEPGWRVEATRRLAGVYADARRLATGADRAEADARAARGADEFRAAGNRLAAARMAALRGAALDGDGAPPGDTPSPLPPANEGVWGVRQVVADVTSQRLPRSRRELFPRDAEMGAFGVAVAGQGFDLPPERRFAVSVTADGQRVAVTNGFGEPLAQLDLGPLGAPLPRRLHSKTQPVAWRVGDLLLISTGIEVFGLAPLETAEPLWSARGGVNRALGGAPGSAPPDVTPGPAPLPGEAGGKLAVVGVGPGDAVLLGEGYIASLNPETGLAAWVRACGALRVDPITDGTRIYLTPKQGDPYALRATDGALAGGWSPPAGEELARFGPATLHLVRTDGGARDGLELRAHRAGEPEPVWERRVADPVHLAQAGPLVALTDGTGDLVVVDLQRGGTLASLDGFVGGPTADGAAAAEGPTAEGPTAGGPVERLDALVLDGRLLVGANLAPAGRHQLNGVEPLDDHPLLTGPLVAFDMDSGSTSWQRPAYVVEAALLGGQPSASGVVLLGCRRETRASAGPSVDAHLTALDASTGRLLRHSGPLRDVGTASHRVRCEGGSWPSVEVRFPRQTFTLTAIDAPAPPGVTYDARVAAPPAASDDLWSLGQRLGRFLSEPTEPPPEPAGRGDPDDD